MDNYIYSYDLIYDLRDKCKEKPECFELQLQYNHSNLSWRKRNNFVIDNTKKRIVPIVNKLSDSNYDKLSNQLFEEINDENAEEVMRIVYMKSILETSYKDLYTRLIRDILSKNKNYIKYLEDLCNKILDDLDKDDMYTEDMDDYEINKIKDRLFGNITYVAELYNKHVFNFKYITYRINILLNSKMTNERVESLCIFMNNLVENIDKNTKEKYKGILEEQYNNKALLSRVRFKCLDVIDNIKKMENRTISDRMREK